MTNHQYDFLAPFGGIFMKELNNSHPVKLKQCLSSSNFVAKGESEMNLEKGEIVCVLKIICDGWVVARKTKLLIDNNGKLLTPELNPVLLNDLNQSIQSNSDNHQNLSLTGLCHENYLLQISYY
ncbi:hypothetical protein PtB15_11B363 [Puccinia triticina]|nr:hypothetical protein PtB15_11B363 [Puccinia triticina]